MAANQFENLGIPLNQWTTLEGVCSRIGLFSNNLIFVTPKTAQFYFEPDNDVVFVRYTTGKPELLTGKTVKDGYVKVSHNSLDYQIRLQDGGVDDSEIGHYHVIYSLDNITGFFK